MEDNLLAFASGLPMEVDDFDSDKRLWNSIVESRKKYDRTLEILDKIKNSDHSGAKVDGIDSDEDINFIVKTTEAVKLKENTIQKVHPGIEIYSEERVGSLFDVDSLSLTKFNISARAKELYGHDSSELLTRLRFCVGYQAINDLGFSRYIFFLMSVHEDTRIIEVCLNLLIRNGNILKVSLNDIFAVFVNWGCSVDILYPKSDEVFQLPEPITDLCVNRNVNSGNFVENIGNVLHYLRSWVSGRRKMKLLIRMLLLSTLDKRFRMISYQFYECICALLKRNAWPLEEMPSFVKLLHFKDLHFHNQAQVAVFLAGKLDIAACLSTGLAYASLQQLLGESTINYVQNVCMHHLLALNLDIVPDKEYYEIYIIVWLLRLCMKDMPFNEEFKKGLREIYAWLKGLKERLKKETTLCDEQLLNEFVSRVLSTWSCEYMMYSAGDLPQQRMLH